MRRRVTELEELCAELYAEGVEIGMPQALLDKIWTVAAHGNRPRTFGVDLPARPQTDAAPLPDIRLIHDPTIATAPRQPLAPVPMRKRLLVVDDDPVVLKVTLRILSQENYELLGAPSGPVALQTLDEHGATIDALVTDYVMPGMSGRELASRLRERDPYLKVLYQTGFTDLLFDARAEVEANAAFIEKPFSGRGLQEAVRLLLFGCLNPHGLKRTA